MTVSSTICPALLAPASAGTLGDAGAVSGTGVGGVTPAAAGDSLGAVGVGVDPAASSGGVRRSQPAANNMAINEAAIATLELFDSVFIIFPFHGISIQILQSCNRKQRILVD
ncbi:hypothetical protein D3C81_1933770 [compost metagenome]